MRAVINIAMGLLLLISGVVPAGAIILPGTDDHPALSAAPGGCCGEDCSCCEDNACSTENEHSRSMVCSCAPSTLSISYLFSQFSLVHSDTVSLLDADTFAFIPEELSRSLDHPPQFSMYA